MAKKQTKTTINGLSLDEVEFRVNAGLTNKVIKPISPSTTWIVVRNLFNLINIFLFPLIMVLLYFQKYPEVLAIAVFAVINSLLSMWDELRIKRRLDKIQVEFNPRATVIRAGKEVNIATDQLVEDDIVIVNEGEGIPTDGEVESADNLLIDESILTGESDYIPKEYGNDVLGGSFVVTGRLIYKVSGLGKSSYINTISSQAKTYRREKSDLQKTGDRLTVFFVVSAVIFGFITFYSALDLGEPISEAVVPLVTGVALIVPQTLIFLFTFSLSIAVVKLSNMGALVQRGSSIETLANLDVLCLDKTGTITKNTMKVVDIKYWNTDNSEIGGYYKYSADKVFGKNKTFEAIIDHYEPLLASDAKGFEQVPFTSKTKVSKHMFEVDGQSVTMIYGAPNITLGYLNNTEEISNYIQRQEETGLRMLLGVVHKTDKSNDIDAGFKTDIAWVISLKEELNPGISEILQEFRDLNTDLKIITGDSPTSVARIVDSLSVDLGDIINLSEFDGNIADIVDDYSIFSRSKPEHKLAIMNALQAQGKTVGMIGDGVNDVLALKSANVSVAMESGASITRDVADIVLLKNDFGLMPKIIFEGNNVVYNLKFIVTVFMSKTFQAMMFLAVAALGRFVFPILPVSTLVYGFLGTSLPSYVISFFRSNVKNSKTFLRRVMPDALISATISAIVCTIVFYFFTQLNEREINTAIIYAALLFSNFFAMHQLYKSGYLPNVFYALAAALVINLIGSVASFIPLVKDYYFLSPLSLTVWGQLIAIAGGGFLVYVVILGIWDRLIKVRIPYFMEA